MLKIHLDCTRLLKLRAFTHGLIFREVNIKALPGFSESSPSVAIIKLLRDAGVSHAAMKNMCRGGINEAALDEMFSEGYGESINKRGKVVLMFKADPESGPRFVGFAMYGLYETNTKYAMERSTGDDPTTQYTEDTPTTRRLHKAISDKVCGAIDIVCAKRDDVKHKGSLLFAYCMCRLMTLFSKKITHVVTHLTNYKQNNLRFLTEKMGFESFKMSRKHTLPKTSDEWLITTGQWKNAVRSYLQESMKSYDKVCRIGSDDLRGFAYCA